MYFLRWRHMQAGCDLGGLGGLDAINWQDYGAFGIQPEFQPFAETTESRLKPISDPKAEFPVQVATRKNQ